MKPFRLKDHWQEWRLRYLLRKGPSEEQLLGLANAKTISFVPMESVGEYGGIDSAIIREKNEVEKGYTLFFDGDVLVAKITPCFENYKGGVANGLYGGIGYGTTELHVLRPKDELNRHFLFYITVSHVFRKLGEASMKGAAGQKRVPDDFILNYRFQLPPLDIQKKIVDYLEKETSQIDALVEQKERMLTLLEEKRVAMISQAVTRGLNSDATMKHSGFKWLGDVPAHWKVKRAKQILKEHDERSVTGEEELLTVSHITGVTKRSEKDVYMFEAETTVGYKVCYPGHLVVNTLWAWMGAMGIAWEKGIVSPSYHVYELSEELAPGFIDALVRTPAFAKEVTRFSKGVWSSRLRLYPEGLYEVYLPVPPLEEQQQIVETIENDREQTIEMETQLKRSIELLKERRKSLITAAVTGQIDPEEMNA